MRHAPRHIKRSIALAVAVVALATLNLAMCSRADAHTPNPAACKLAWQAAPPGAKWTALQRCRAMQARHVAIEQAIRRCLHVPGSDMGATLCSAIASVRLDWADDAALHELLHRESGWNPNAVNEGSGACGAWQRLPCPWRYHAGTSSASDDRVYASAVEQARNGLSNIRGRYGTPSGALAAHNRQGWY